MDPEFIDQTISLSARFFAVLGSISLLFLILKLIIGGHLKVGYSLLWLFLVGLTLIFSVFSELLFFFSQVIGIFYAPASLFLIAISNLLLISVHYSVALTKQERKVKELAQELALVKDQLKIKGTRVKK